MGNREKEISSRRLSFKVGVGNLLMFLVNRVALEVVLHSYVPSVTGEVHRLLYYDTLSGTRQLMWCPSSKLTRSQEEA